MGEMQQVVLAVSIESALKAQQEEKVQQQQNDKDEKVREVLRAVIAMHTHATAVCYGSMDSTDV